MIKSMLKCVLIESNDRLFIKNRISLVWPFIGTQPGRSPIHGVAVRLKMTGRSLIYDVAVRVLIEWPFIWPFATGIQTPGANRSFGPAPMYLDKLNKNGSKTHRKSRLNIEMKNIIDGKKCSKNSRNYLLSNFHPW